MKNFLLLCSLLFSLLYGETFFPKTATEVDIFTQSIIQEINLSLGELQHKSAEELLPYWDKLRERVFISACILHSLPALFNNPHLAQAGEIALQKLQSHLLQSVKKMPLPAHMPSSRAPFTFLPGKCGSFPDKETLTLLSWNVCCLPSPIPLIFGGILPWEERKERLVAFLKEHDPDIICLQEVFDLEAAQYMYASLKDSYAEFYTNIGPKPLSLHPHAIGLNSGLFIASKYPLKNLHFEKFTSAVKPVIERGFFSYTVTHGNQCYRIVTTHLENSPIAPNPSSAEEECRHRQLEQILTWIDKDPKLSTLLAGDLNICQGSKEKAELLLHKAFYNLCKGNVYSYCDYTGYFWPEYFLNEKRKFFQPKFYLLDYALMRPLAAHYEHIKAEILQAHNPQAPTQALSDHHCLFITISK